MKLSIKINNIISKMVNFTKNFNNWWEKYLLTVNIEIIDIQIKKEA